MKNTIGVSREMLQLSQVCCVFIIFCFCGLKVIVFVGGDRGYKVLLNILKVTVLLIWKVLSTPSYEQTCKVILNQASLTILMCRFI